MTHLDFQVSASQVSTVAFMPAVQGEAFVDPFVIDVERPDDVAARESLLDRAFGPARFRKTCQRLRAGRLPARGLSLVARAHPLGGGGPLIGTVRLWHVEAGGVPALMLGPLAVDTRARGLGVGARLMAEAIARARASGHDAILLVGDKPFYRRFGFARRHTLALRMPGPVDEARFLGLELTPGAFIGAHGLVAATGAMDLAARRGKQHKARLRRAA